MGSLALSVRFFLLWLPRVLAGRCAPTRLANYAIALAEAGHQHLSSWCWTRLVRSIDADERRLDPVLDLCFGAGHCEAAEALAIRCYDQAGLLPASGIRLLGSLLLAERFEAALRVLERLVGECGVDFPDRSPSPFRSRLESTNDLRSMLAARACNDGTTRARQVDLSFARVCFSFGAFACSSGLFQRAFETEGAIDATDRIAHAYSLLRSRGISFPAISRADHCTDSEAEEELPHWRAYSATVRFAQGDVQRSAYLVERALRDEFGSHSDLQGIVEDCRGMVYAIARSPDSRRLAFDTNGDRNRGAGPGLAKLFICGHGWSGSGAVYDALMEYDRFVEPPKAVIDRHLNADTDSEMMFVQGISGLGRIWRRARQTGELDRMDLWDLFKCHVVGEGAIGYAEHKGANVARHLMERFGRGYTSAFRRMYDELGALEETASLADLRAALRRCTERLCEVLTAPHSGNGIVFNNAVFARNLDMLDIFINAKAVVVTRDPLDQYADRRNQDLKHWMSPPRFARFYRESMEICRSQQRDLTARGVDVREVEFERFVVDEPYRRRVIEWASNGQHEPKVRQLFDPDRSAANIGIHRTSLTEEERSVIQRELEEYRAHRYTASGASFSGPHG